MMAHSDNMSAERPPFREPTDNEIAGLDRDDERERGLTLHEFMDEQECRAEGWA